MPKKFTYEEDKRVVDFCLKCDKSTCRGTCDELKVYKRKIVTKSKGKKKKGVIKNECNN